MASAYRTIADGIVIAIQSGIANCKAYAYPPDTVNSFPAAIVLPEPLDTQITFKSNTFTATFRVIFLVASGDVAEGFMQLYDYLDPVEVGKSLIKAIRDDTDLASSTDDSDIIRIENIGRRELWGNQYFGFDAILEVIKTLA